MKNYKFKVKRNARKNILGMRVMFKKCPKCGEILFRDKFYNNKKSLSGLDASCKECKNSKYTHTCEQCGKEFSSKAKERRFCSQKCLAKWKSENMSGKNSVHYNSVEVSCSYCGSKVVVNKYKYENKNNHFCNIECKAKWQSENVRGENHPRYNPNLTDEEREQERKYPEYIEFVKEVLKRDNYTCLLTGQVGERDLAVHHLNGYNWCKEGRTDIDNGVTLKNWVHDLFHKLYGKGNNTKEQFEEFKIRFLNGEFEEVV